MLKGFGEMEVPCDISDNCLNEMMGWKPGKSYLKKQ
jgi:hypothetical protein